MVEVKVERGIGRSRGIGTGRGRTRDRGRGEHGNNPASSIHVVKLHLSNTKYTLKYTRISNYNPSSQYSI